MGGFFWLFFLLHYQISLINFLVMQIGSVAPETALSVWRSPIYLEIIQRQFEGVSAKIRRDPGGNPSLSESSDAHPEGVSLSHHGSPAPIHTMQTEHISLRNRMFLWAFDKLHKQRWIWKSNNESHYVYRLISFSLIWYRAKFSLHSQTLGGILNELRTLLHFGTLVK